MISEVVLQWMLRHTPLKPWPLAVSAMATAAGVAAALALRLLFDPLLGDSVPYVFTFAVTLALGYFCGALFTALATVVLAVLNIMFFVSPRYEISNLAHQWVQIAVFAVVSAILATAAILLRTAVGALRARQYALETSDTNARQVADLSPQIVWAARAGGKLDYYNKRWFEFSGADPTTIQSDWSPYVHPEDVEASRERWVHALRSGEPYEVEFRLRRADGEYRWFLARALPFQDETGRVVRWFGSNTDVHDRKMAQAMMETLSGELHHRIKNIFAVVTSLVALSARNHPEGQPFAAELRKRLDSLGRAHDYALPNSDALRSATPEPTLFALVRLLLEPYAADTTDRLTIDGDDIAIADRAATPIALIIHELATNATKYGALSVPGGQVFISGARDGDTFALTWRETGGPAVTAPDGKLGFGSRLLDVSAMGQLGGDVTRAWDSGGVRVTIRVPVASIARATD